MMETENKIKVTAAELFRTWENQPFADEEPVTPEMIRNLEDLFRLYSLGQQFVYVYDYQLGRILFVSDNVKDILGYPSEVINPEFLYSKIHPEDLDEVLRITRAAGELVLRYKDIEVMAATLTIDCRVQDADGQYRKMQRQTSIFRRDSNGNVQASFGIFTDISHLNRGNAVYFDLNVPEYKSRLLAILEEEAPVPALHKLSVREKQILRLMALGKNTRQIAQELSLSKFTVDTHRKNMKKKLKTRNTAQLISLAANSKIIN